MVVCGGVWWFVVICGGLSFSHTLLEYQTETFGMIFTTKVNDVTRKASVSESSMAETQFDHANVDSEGV